MIEFIGFRQILLVCVVSRYCDWFMFLLQVISCLLEVCRFCSVVVILCSEVNLDGCSLFSFSIMCLIFLLFLVDLIICSRLCSWIFLVLLLFIVLVSVWLIGLVLNCLIRWFFGVIIRVVWFCSDLLVLVFMLVVMMNIISSRNSRLKNIRLRINWWVKFMMFYSLMKKLVMGL